MGAPSLKLTTFGSPPRPANSIFLSQPGTRNFVHVPGLQTLAW